MITDVRYYALNRDIHAVPGDSIAILHNVDGEVTKVFEKAVVFEATWTHSILWRLNGEMQWMLGTIETVNWLKKLEG